MPGRKRNVEKIIPEAIYYRILKARLQVLIVRLPYIMQLD